jgi:hypothetical protein
MYTCSYLFTFHDIYCRVCEVTRHNLWVLDLTLDLLDFNSYNYSYSLHKFTTHKPETCLLVRYHFTSYLSCLPVSPLSVFVLTVRWLFQISVSHPLKRVLCWLNRGHRVEPFNFLFSETTATSLFVTVGTPLLRFHFCGNDLLCACCHVNVFVIQTMIQETWLQSRCLAMDVRSDSDIPSFRRQAIWLPP